MAFGKRAAGDLPPSHPAREAEGPEAVIATPGGMSIRTRVANPGEMDRSFIALAIGVVVLSAGGALAAPSLFAMFTGVNVRPIAEVVAGLDRAEARTALGREAFPDVDGAAFMVSLATSFPKEHGRLLDTLADSAMAGGDRDDLFSAMNAWSMGFGQQNLEALSRTGAEGFDKSIGVVSSALKVIEAEAGGCSAKQVERFFLSPTGFADLQRYGGKGYQLGMRATRDFVELAARGRTMPPAQRRLDANDNNALRTAFFSLMGERQVLDLIQASSMSGVDQQQMRDQLASSVNLCQLGRTVLIKLEGLPSGTKARLFGTVLSGDASALMGAGNLGLPFGPESFSGTTFR